MGARTRRARVFPRRSREFMRGPDLFFLARAQPQLSAAVEVVYILSSVAELCREPRSVVGYRGQCLECLRRWARAFLKFAREGSLRFHVLRAHLPGWGGG